MRNSRKHVSVFSSVFYFFTDLTVGLIEVLPRTLERANDAIYLLEHPSLRLPLCQIQRCLGHVALVTSNFILAAMSIDRAQVVVSPMKRFKRGNVYFE